MRRTASFLLKFLAWTFLIILLTFLSQTGGAILLLFLIIRFFLPKNSARGKRIIRNWLLFLLLYGGINFLIVPQLAQRSGKVPLPVFSENLRPHRLAFALLNRHYVTPEMQKTMLETADAMSQKFPGTVTYYLDGSHPIGTPRLYPHLKHKSGRKLDVCFFYQNKNDKEKQNNPSLFGYGFFAPPLPGERDLPAECAAGGSRLYSFTGNLVRKSTGKNTEIDPERTAYFLKLLSERKEVRRLFIEPHLKERFGFANDNKVRFHGCWAVRHDDHVHLEVR